jgi:hypothetical protein
MYRFGTSIPGRVTKNSDGGEGRAAGATKCCAEERRKPMVTWVLTEEPNAAVRRAIELIEDRVASDSDVMWLCPTEAAEPIQE